MGGTAAQTADDATGLQLGELKPGFGIDVRGIDLRSAPQTIMDTIVNLYNHHSAMVIRDQSLSVDELMEFASSLGNVVEQSREEQTLPGYPAISVLSNKKADGKLIGVHWNGLGWHTDGTYLPRPLIGTMLYGLECPPEGGDTLIADTHAAFRALPYERQAELEPLTVVHSFSYLADKQAKKMGRVPATDEQKRAFPDRTHPLVMIQPETGKKSFYLTGGTSKGIEGMDDEDGRKIVEELIRYSTQDKFVYRHKWTAGDLLIWNDLYTMHSATLYDDQKYDRLMYRVWLD